MFMPVSLLKRLTRKAFRHAYMRAHLCQGLAYQLQALRIQRGWTPSQLAEKLGGMDYSLVEQLENPANARPSITTLLQLSEVFDVALLVKFVPYSQLLRETADLSPQALAVDSFDNEVFSADYEIP